LAKGAETKIRGATKAGAKAKKVKLKKRPKTELTKADEEILAQEMREKLNMLKH